MKRCKLIVTDLDGTLLRNDKSISTFTLEILNECRKRGVLIAFATARPVRGVEQVRKIFEPDVLINHNGAVFAYEGNQVSLGIDKVSLDNLLENIFKVFPGAEVGAEANDIFYANYDVTKYWKDESFMRTETSFVGAELAYGDKVLVSLNDIDINVLAACLPTSCYLEVADGFMGMIMSKKATKFNAITSFCDAWEIHSSEVICFGDDDNDISMISGCGIGVAMENANERVKSIADVVCLTNEKDGVAQWINEFVLKGCRN